MLGVGLLHAEPGASEGMIEPDTGEEWISVSASSCVDLVLPAHTRVVYRHDGGSATEVVGEDTDFHGTLDQVNQTFGFILTPREDRIFVMPIACAASRGQLPPRGTALKFKVVMDSKSGRPRADFVRPDLGAGPSVANEKTQRTESVISEHAGKGQGSNKLLGSRLTGVVEDPGEKYGFIMQDDGSKMFVLPGCCMSFGGIIPPAGTRVVYDVVEDPKTGRPRAENVQPSNSGSLVTALNAAGGELRPSTARDRSTWQGAGTTASTVSETRSGVMAKNCGSFGFIEQLDGETIFVLPGSCLGGAELPPLGTCLDYEIVTDGKTGRLRAEHVRPAQAFGVHSGTIDQSGAQYGFIRQDTPDGHEVRMFVLPLSCGGQIPPVGTRVMYEVVEDSKTGRPRAENVQTTAPSHGPGGGGVQHSGSILQVGPTYGFIQPDDGGEKMFVLPGSCTACGDFGIPPVGTRVLYSITIDQKTGRPRADQVTLEGQRVAERAGYIQQQGEKYGFITQDNGESMFLMPAACAAFGSVIPPEGTRVVFRVVADSKTGRPRAEDVMPEMARASGGKILAGHPQAKRFAPY